MSTRGPPQPLKRRPPVKKNRRKAEENKPDSPGESKMEEKKPNEHATPDQVKPESPEAEPQDGQEPEPPPNPGDPQGPGK